MLELKTRNATDRIALRGVRLRCHVAGMCQRTTVEQTFLNTETRDVEAIYTFPLPDGAAVCEFEVITGEKVLTGRVEDADEAVEQYEQAIADGDGAFMVEQNRPDIFTIRVGNIKPRQAVMIRLTYVAQLEVADRSIRLAFPTTVAPRYVAQGDDDPLEKLIDADAINPPHLLHVPYGLSMEVRIALGRPVASIESPSHGTLTRQESDDGYLVTLSAGMTAMDRDIVLNIGLEQDAEPTVQVGRQPDGEAFLAVTFMPEFELEDVAPADVVFVLDCSGSMAGLSIEQAKAALELCLRSLSEGDTFNICRFGSTFELMSREPLVYSAKTLRKALAYLRRIDADLGGTELRSPLEAILAMPQRPDAPRQIVLLTDGQVSNEPKLIALARKKAGGSRFFTFGIGSACSTYLVRGLARATGGAAELITENERIEDKILRTFSRMASPMVTDVAIDWGGMSVEQAPADVPPVFDGDALTVFGRAIDAVPQRVTLSCKTPFGPRSWQVAIGAARDESGVIPTMWARRMIETIEDTDRPSPRTPTESDTRLIALSKRYGVLCGRTTFIAVEHRTLEDRTSGQPAVRRVPVMLAQGWGGIEGLAAMDLCMAPPPAMAPAPAGYVRKARSARRGRRMFSRLRPASADHEDLDEAPPPASDLGDDLLRILSSQEADGGFNAADVLDRLFADAWSDVPHVRSQIESFLVELSPAIGKADVSDLTRVVMVLLIFRIQFPDRRRHWKRADTKTRTLLAKSLSTKRKTIAERLDALIDALAQC